jgi:hypothetical protein
MLRASLGKVVRTVGRAGTYVAKVSLQELHKIAVRERAVFPTAGGGRIEAGGLATKGGRGWNGGFPYA